MSRVFKRPMFRKGGNVGEGIMTGIRDNYELGGSAEEQLAKIAEQYPQQGFDPLTQFLIQGGLNLVSQPSTGGVLSDIATAAKDPTQQLFKGMAEKGKLARELAIAGKQIDIEQAGKEKLLEKEIAGRKEIAGMETKISPEKAVLLEQNIEIYGPDNMAVANRATDFQSEQSGDLYRKVGVKAGGVLKFDINDPSQVKQQMKEIKRLDGKVMYDPYQDNYKLIKINKKTKQPEVIPYGNIKEVPSGQGIDTVIDTAVGGTELSEFAIKTNKAIEEARKIKEAEEKKKRSELLRSLPTDISDPYGGA
jgi:hypothetical protein